MSNQLTQLEDWVAPLLNKLSAQERRKLATSLARELRRSQQQRIRRQENSDGTPYSPRKKPPQRSKTGRIKRQAKMFTKIRLAKHLRLMNTASGVSIGFTNRIGRIARTHQYGLRDRPSKRQPNVKYPTRQLLGFTKADLDLIQTRLIEHLS